MSRHAAYAKEIVCAHAFLKGVVPLNPFMMFGYFLYDLIDRDIVRTANSRIVSAVEEVWSYGPISNGGLAEILQAKGEGKVVRYFNVAPRVSDIIELNNDQLEFETQSLKDEFIAANQ